MLFYVCVYVCKREKMVESTIPYHALHKTDGRFYLTKEDAEEALHEDEYGELKHGGRA